MNNERMKTILIRDEGKRNFAYDDSTGETVKLQNGNLSIGIGHNLQANGLSDKVIDMIYQEDIKEAEIQCRQYFSYFEDLREPRQEILCMLCFSLGIEKLKKFKRMNAALVHGNYANAANEILDSKAARQLKTRYLFFAQVMRDGHY